MKKLDRYKIRFERLMESKNGDVKPLLSEMGSFEDDIRAANDWRDEMK